MQQLNYGNLQKRLLSMHIARTCSLPKWRLSGLRLNGSPENRPSENRPSDRLAQLRHYLLASQRLVRRAIAASVTASIAVFAPGAFADDHADVQLDTSYGRILLSLDEQRAPESVQNFLAYVDDGFYDGTLFHRVIEGFMIQGGGFTESYMQKQTRSPIRNEADNGLSNRAYTISMARTNEPHSGTSQFFINTVDNGNLDHTDPSGRGWGYAVFGRVVDGFDVVDRISEASTGRGGPFSRDAPKEPIVIESVQRLLPAAAPASGTNPDPANTNIEDESQANAAAAN